MSNLPQDFVNALRVLAMTVIIDQRIRETELEAFEQQSSGLADLFELSPDATSDYIRWYRDNYDGIREELESRSRNTVILKAITAIKDSALREALYDGMLAVSISDDEYHQKESDFVRSAAAIWGYVRPPFKVINN